MRTLHLNLKRKWYDLILDGEKDEEYRELTPYWFSRLVEIEMLEEEKGENKTIPHNVIYDIIENGYSPDVVMKSYTCKFKNFDTVTFSNGYSKNRDQFIVECLGIHIRTGCTWIGAERGKKYFVIRLGKVIHK